MKLRLVQSLQVGHLIALFLAPVLWFALTNASDADDTFVRAVTAITGLSMVAWGALVVVLSIRYGEKSAGLNRLFSLYRKLLSSVRFLCLTNIVLLAVLTVLTYQIVAYRQVEFSARLGGQLISSDAPGNMYVVGSLAPNQPKRFRLRTGRRNLAFQTGNSIVPLSVEVRPWWHELRIQHIDIPVKEENYEQLK
jgi:hypothetical protein